MKNFFAWIAKLFLNFVQHFTDIPPRTINEVSPNHRDIDMRYLPLNIPDTLDGDDQWCYNQRNWEIFLPQTIIKFKNGALDYRIERIEIESDMSILYHVTPACGTTTPDDPPWQQFADNPAMSRFEVPDVFLNAARIVTGCHTHNIQGPKKYTIAFAKSGHLFAKTADGELCGRYRYYEAITDTTDHYDIARQFCKAQKWVLLSHQYDPETEAIYVEVYVDPNGGSEANTLSSEEISEG